MSHSVIFKTWHIIADFTFMLRINDPKLVLSEILKVKETLIEPLRVPLDGQDVEHLNIVNLTSADFYYLYITLFEIKVLDVYMKVCLFSND